MLKEFKIKNRDSKFIARVEAESERDALDILKATSTCTTQTMSGRVVFPTDVDFIQRNLGDHDLEDLIAEVVTPTTRNSFKGKNCVYCTNKPSTTGEGDHVIARGFFDQSNRNNTTVPIMVPACTTCNGNKSYHEEYVIAHLALDINAYNNADARSLYDKDGPLRNAAERKRGPILSILNNVAPIIIFDENGIGTETGIMPLDWQRIHELMFMITKGLYYHHKSIIFPDTLEVFTSQVDEATWGKLKGFISHWSVDQANMGNGVFDYTFAHHKTNPDVSLLLISIYDGSFKVVVNIQPKRNVGDLFELQAGSLPPLMAGLYCVFSIIDDKVILVPVQRDPDNTFKRSGKNIAIKRSKLSVFIKDDMSGVSLIE